MIEPWIPAPAQIVVYEYGARLDEPSQALARGQIAQARELYNRLVGCIHWHKLDRPEIPAAL